ncbi:hypothetical protein K443DRAFT_111437, partial [Laccaria amethystina LaAM-08-1]
PLDVWPLSTNGLLPPLDERSPSLGEWPPSLSEWLPSLDGRSSSLNGQSPTGSYHLHHVAPTVAVEHLDQLPEMK